MAETPPCDGDDLPVIEPWRAFPMIGFLCDRGVWGAVALAALPVVAYYGVLFVMNGLQGTLVPPDFAESGQWPALARAALGALAARQSTAPIEHYALTDRTHAVFSLISLPVGALLCCLLVRVIGSSFHRLWSNQVLGCGRARFSQILVRMQRSFEAPVTRLGPLVPAAVLFLTFVYMVREPAYAAWWGHHAHGWAGYYLAFIVSCSLYYGVSGAALLLIVYRAIKELMDCPIVLRPLHPDRCNGFRPLGDVVLTMYVGVVWAGVALFAVYFMGYFGLENLPGMWTTIVLYLVLAPVVFVLPTHTISRALSRARLRRLLALEAKAQLCYERMHASVLNGPDEESAKLCERFKQLGEAIELNLQISIWPFDMATVRTVALTYVLQIGIVLYETLKG